MEKTKTKLCWYGGTSIPVEGKIKVMCEFRDAKQKLEFYVVKTDSKTVYTQFRDMQRTGDDTNTQ